MSLPCTRRVTRMHGLLTVFSVGKAMLLETKSDILVK
jgi:hypothetical protein